jgi:hypothetical protein
MLKKILILSLILNTQYILPSHSSSAPRYDAAAICMVAGIVCSWKAYKDFKNGWSASGEINNQIKILNEMGVKVYKKTKLEYVWYSDSPQINDYYSATIPSHLSQQEAKKAEEHWNLLLVNHEYDKKMLGWPSIGSVILLAAGIMELSKALA